VTPAQRLTARDVELLAGRHVAKDIDGVVIEREPALDHTPRHRLYPERAGDPGAQVWLGCNHCRERLGLPLRMYR